MWLWAEDSVGWIIPWTPTKRLGCGRVLKKVGNNSAAQPAESPARHPFEPRRNEGTKGGGRVDRSGKRHVCSSRGDEADSPGSRPFRLLVPAATGNELTLAGPPLGAPALNANT